ncbi:hypothetical protein [Anaerovibrio sp. RM50]|uniref:hypothetical protein n=1 Tax=Anaerovibrio sp. RM50 TaxID=1200557 RepID=UPI000484B5DC|nr:hypothetical protein [Anaerovibrio sp. RM50]
MNKRAEIIKLLTPYLMAFPNSKMNEGSLLVYSKALSGLELVEIEAAMNKLILTSKFFPSVAEIYEQARLVRQYAVAESSGVRDLTESEAWDNAMQVVKEHGLLNSEPWNFANEKVAKAARRFGLKELSLLRTDEVNIARGQFTRFYREIMNEDNDNEYNKLVLGGMRNDDVNKLIGKIAEVKQIGKPE